MQTKNRFLDDGAKLVMGLLKVGQGVKNHLRDRVLNHAERYVIKMELVNRQEFEIVREIAQEARIQSETLNERVNMLEKKLE